VPDIFVKINPQVEHEVLFSAPTNVTLTASLQPHVKKRGLTEAELVKAFRGEALETPTLTLERAEEKTNTLGLGVSTGIGTNVAAAAEEPSGIQPVRDVVLQRAVDILKGIRVLLSWQ
jgi:hypothetical protein